jgi:hypothetical protein
MGALENLLNFKTLSFGRIQKPGGRRCHNSKNEKLGGPGVTTRKIILKSRLFFFFFFFFFLSFWTTFYGPTTKDFFPPKLGQFLIELELGMRGLPSKHD